MLGRSQEAEITFLSAVKASRGRSLGTYAKSFCSLQTFSDAQVEELWDAADAFHLLKGVLLLVWACQSAPEDARCMHDACLPEQSSYM